VKVLSVQHAAQARKFISDAMKKYNDKFSKKK